MPTIVRFYETKGQKTIKIQFQTGQRATLTVSVCEFHMFGFLELGLVEGSVLINTNLVASVRPVPQTSGESVRLSHMLELNDVISGICGSRSGPE